MAIDTPHFAYPFRLDGTRFAVDEQDSDRDILNCAYAVLATPKGSRDDEPEFGIEEQAFRQGGVLEATIEEVLATWEPRVEGEVEGEALTELVQRVRTEV